MRLKYNAPTVLTFTFISTGILILSLTVAPSLTGNWFVVSGKGSFSLTNIRCWITLFTHVLGHQNWDHLLSNFTLILLIGPILEEHYGSMSLLFMMAVTALVTGGLNVIFFQTGLLGASGVLFMMIFLASFTNFNEGEIPLTFILVMVLYIGRELYNSFVTSNVSQFAHIAGGFCGSLFGFITANNRQNSG